MTVSVIKDNQKKILDYLKVKLFSCGEKFLGNYTKAIFIAVGILIFRWGWLAIGSLFPSSSDIKNETLAMVIALFMGSAVVVSFLAFNHLKTQMEHYFNKKTEEFFNQLNEIEDDTKTEKIKEKKPHQSDSVPNKKEE